MSTYYVTSDNVFLSSMNLNAYDITVRDYGTYFINDWGSLLSSFPVAKDFTVGPTSNSGYKALSIQGVVFEGEKLKMLSLELFKNSFVVNRQGYCLHIPGRKIMSSSPLWINQCNALKLNDLFPWSYFGVTTSPSPTEWSRRDMSNYGAPFLVNIDYKKLLEEKDRMTEKVKIDYKKLLDSKNSELERCKSQQSSLQTEVNKYKKMSEEKDRILEDYKKQFLEQDQLKKELQDSQEEMKKCKKMLEDKEKLLEDYKKQIQEKGQLNEELQEELSDCKNTQPENDAEVKQSSRRLEKIKALKALVNSLVDSVNALSAVLHHVLSNQDSLQP